MIRWEEIETVSVNGPPQHESLTVAGSGLRVRIRIDFLGYPGIKELILKRYEATSQSAGAQPE
jgi:hypothetical protein